MVPGIGGEFVCLSRTKLAKVGTVLDGSSVSTGTEQRRFFCLFLGVIFD